MGKETEQIYKVLSITNQQGRASQKHEISSHTCKNIYSQKKTKGNKCW